MIFLFFISSLFAQNNFVQNVQTALTVDILHSQIVNEEKPPGSTEVRSTEMLFYGAIDHQFDGFLNVAAHQHEGEMEMEIHEGFIRTVTLIPGYRVRAGKFFINYGRLNNFHQHDWVFTIAPRIHQELFSFEGVSAPGMEVSKVLDLPFYLELNLGVIDGRSSFGHAHEHEHEAEEVAHEEKEAFAPAHPTIYFHPTTFFQMSNGAGVQIGASMLKRDDLESGETEIKSLDFTFKKRTGSLLNALLQFELHSQYAQGTGEKTEGAYLYSQYSLDAQWLYGFMIDGFQTEHTLEENKRGYDLTFGPSLTYKSSEFALIRGTILRAENSELEDMEEYKGLFQMTFILGAHPAHEF